MLILRFATLLSVSCAALSAEAETLLYDKDAAYMIVAMTKEGFSVVDLRDNKPPSIGKVKTWEIRYYSPPQFKLKGRPVTIVQTQIEVDCTSKETRRLYGYAYENGAKFIEQGSFRDGWAPIPSGSHLSNIRELVCVGHDKSATFNDLVVATTVFNEMSAEGLLKN